MSINFNSAYCDAELKIEVMYFKGKWCGGTQKNNVEDKINFINTQIEFLSKREIFGRKLFAHS